VLLPPSVRGTKRAGTGKFPSKITAPGHKAIACSLLGQRSTSKEKTIYWAQMPSYHHRQLALA